MIYEVTLFNNTDFDDESVVSHRFQMLRMHSHKLDLWCEFPLICICMCSYLFIFLFVNLRPARKIFPYGDVTIVGEGLKKFGLYSTTMAFDQGSLSCHTCCDTGPRFLWCNPKDHPDLEQSPFTSKFWGSTEFSNLCVQLLDSWCILRYFKAEHYS